MIKQKDINRTIVTQKKLDRAHKYGYEIGKSNNPHRNKCRYNNFELRQEWYRGYWEALK